MTGPDALPYYSVRVEFTNLADGTVTVLDAGRVRDLDLSCEPDRDEDTIIDYGSDRLPPPVRSFSLSVTGTVPPTGNDPAVTMRVITEPKRSLADLASDWDANGNSRPLGDPTADTWHAAARQLRDALGENR